MEIHQLRYLVLVVDQGSFTAAGATANVSQSGISAQVAKLERELGQRLLERGPRSLRLTAAGEAVLPLARRALAALDEITEAADDLREMLRGRVSMGMVRGCSIPPFLDTLAEFRHDHPGVELTLAESESDELQRRVLSGELDLALIGYAGEVLGGLRSVVVVDEPLAVAVPPHHRLAHRRSVRLEDLSSESLLCLPEGTGVREAFDRSRTASPAEVRVAMEASSPETLLGLARRGTGVAVLSGSMIEGAEGLVPLTVADASVNARLGLVVRDDAPSTAPRALLEAMTSALT